MCKIDIHILIQQRPIYHHIAGDFVEMTIKLEFNDLELNANEQKQLAAALGCQLQKLEDTLQPYAKAALLEYISVFLGRTNLTRGTDTKEYRLFLLMKEVFKNQIPEEQKISGLFHITSSQSKTLIKAVLSKNRYALEETVKAALIKTMEQAKENKDDNGDSWVTINNLNIVDELNHILTIKDGTLPKILRKAGTVSTYMIKASSYQSISIYLNIN
jgi:hypothetical protein